jgi:cobalt-zinc-cadmium efflux system protein
MHDSPALTKKNKRLLFALVLTGLIFIAEFAGGLWTGSLALLSDAAHVFMDVFALGLSYLAIRAAALPPTATTACRCWQPWQTAPRSC